MANVSIPLPRNGLFVHNFQRKLPTFPILRFRTPTRVSCYGIGDLDGSETKEKLPNFNDVKGVASGILAAWTMTRAFAVIAANQRLPPLSTESNQCERAFIGNTVSQANALMSDAKFDGADMTEVVMSKAYAVGASFKGVDFPNSGLDRVNFEKADLQGAVLKSTVLSGSTCDEAKLEDAVFEDTLVGYIDLQKLCTNKSINEEGRIELGCR